MKYFPRSTGVFILAGVFFFSSQSSGKRLTNYEVLRAQVDTLSDSVVKILSSMEIKSLKCRTGTGEVDSFVRERVEERLLENRLHLISDSSAGPQLRITVPLLNVSYSPPVSSHIFSSSDVVRYVRSDFTIGVSDGNEVMVRQSFSFSYSDTVNESQIPDLEAGSFAFIRGKPESEGLVDIMLQPVLFLASAVVIVYLFFTLRGS